VDSVIRVEIGKDGLVITRDMLRAAKLDGYTHLRVIIGDGFIRILPPVESEEEAKSLD
jgi:hypothetical protein